MNLESSERKVMIIAYYWPPSGGSGVQRWLKFVKYLPTVGWTPFVFTPENPQFQIQDPSLQRDVPPSAEIIRFPIWEPYHLFNRISRLLGGKKGGYTDQIAVRKTGWLQRVSSWIRGNFFIPDARIFWVRPSVEFLSDLLKANDIKTIVTTGPPHSLHLIGLKLKRKNPQLQWIADFRDPWSEWDLLDTLSLTSWARSRHQKLEREVLRTADRVLTIAPYHVARLEALGGRKVDLMTNGFDEDDFKSISRKRTDRLTIRHIGMVDALRDPLPFMGALAEWLKEVPSRAGKVRVEFIGSVNAAFQAEVQADSVLQSVVSFRAPIPHHALLETYGETDIQLLVLAHTALAPGNLPGKIFEYLASGNFILGIGPAQSDAADMLQKTSAGIILERTDAAGIRRALDAQLSKWERGEGDSERNISAYSRRELTSRLAEILEQLQS